MPAGRLSVLSSAVLFVGSTALSDEMEKILEQHNVYRCMHGLPALAWDDSIAAKAQAFADKGNYAHSSNAEREHNGTACGENLAWGYPRLHPRTAARDWYQEIQFTSPYGQATGMDDSTPVGKPIGHYTQQVWRETTKIGCGKGPASVSGNTGDTWVCQYCSAGNSAGQFARNVPAPIKSPTQCDGSNRDVPPNFPTDLLAATPVPTPGPSGVSPTPSPQPNRSTSPGDGGSGENKDDENKDQLGDLSGDKVEGHFELWGVDMTAFCKNEAAMDAVRHGVADECKVAAAYVRVWCPNQQQGRRLSGSTMDYSIQVPAGADANAIRSAIYNDQALRNDINQRLFQGQLQVTVGGVVATVRLANSGGGSMCNGAPCASGNSAALGSMNGLFQVSEGPASQTAGSDRTPPLGLLASGPLLLLGSLVALAVHLRSRPVHHEGAAIVQESPTSAVE